MRTLLTARWVIGDEGGQRRLLEHGQVVVDGSKIVFVGHGFTGEVARRIDYGAALIGPGFIDLDALSDLDTTILGYDNHPGWKKGRVWPRDYLESGPREMYTADELVWQKRYAFAWLIRNGITTALPIASLFYRAWGETYEEFAGAADAARELGLRVYLGPAYRAGNQVLDVVDGKPKISAWFDEERGLANLDEAVRFCRDFEGGPDALVRTMLSPDRIETCTPELLRRTAAVSAELDVPIRQHCCQSKIEYDMVLELRGMSPPEWMASLGYLSERSLLPHGTIVSGSRHVSRPGHDLEIIRDSGAAIVHCPLVSGRHGNGIESFRRYRQMGLKIGMGTDTSPPDMIWNMRMGMALCRYVEADVGAVSSGDYYDAATLGGAEALRRPDLGRIATGAKADITVMDLRGAHLGQVIDPVQTMMLVGSGRDFRSVMIDGRFVMEDYVIPGVDWDADTARAQGMFDHLIEQYPDRTFGHPPVSEIFPGAYPIVRAA